MNTHTLVTLFALLLVGAGCRSVATAPVAATQAVLASGDATLEMNALRPSENTAHFYVAVIDGPKGRQELALGPIEGFYRLQPGINTLTIKTLTYDITAPDADSEASTAILVFAAAPGVAYTLNGFDDGKNAHAVCHRAQHAPTRHRRDKSSHHQAGAATRAPHYPDPHPHFHSAALTWTGPTEGVERRSIFTVGLNFPDAASHYPPTSPPPIAASPPPPTPPKTVRSPPGPPPPPTPPRGSDQSMTSPRNAGAPSYPKTGYALDLRAKNAHSLSTRAGIVALKLTS